MPLSFKPSAWEAESKVVKASIHRTATGFEWEIFSKVDKAVVTSGVAPSLSKARQACQSADATIEQAEQW